MSTSATSTLARPIASSAIARIAQAASAICFGAVIVGFVGFSHIEAVHNAGHDNRHSMAFPCH